MMNIKLATDNRKEAAARLAEITGTESHYTKVPRCAYEIGPYFIEKDGNYIMKHAGEYPPEGGKEITKEEFVKGSAEIATGKKRTRRTRKVRESK